MGNYSATQDLRTVGQFTASTSPMEKFCFWAKRIGRLSLFYKRIGWYTNIIICDGKLRTI